ncbi:sensor histidine kinase [Micromonospora sp. HM5-17]|uniref:sensor histidine kinase n=1 Tax=Micromonospora sp. HM5-17 TaxID=2487710 RepID=UPI000F4A180C|nr:histidine kinase [Micromonospora sp. HM5-17]ROT29699.1 hypothetical protein EF879_18840 [Micromonospora sp. HM5-17]
MGTRLLAAAVLVADTALLVAGRPDLPLWVVAGYVLVAALAIALSGRAPLVALGVALVLAPATGTAYVLLLWTAYRAGRGVLSRPGTGVLVGLTVGALAVRLAAVPARSGALTTLVASYLVFVGLPVLTGRYLAQQGRLVATLERHNRQLRRERELLAEQEQLRERLRIARDMHDSLGHRLSLVSVQAAALEVSPQLPPAQREAVRQLADAARRAAAELYELVGALRGARTGADRPADLSAVPALIAEFRAAGVPVTSHHSGRPRPLSPAAGQAAYRVVQEGLTNAAKHAPGRPVTVRLRWEPDALLVELVNPLPADGRPHRRIAHAGVPASGAPADAAAPGVVVDGSPGRPGTRAEVGPEPAGPESGGHGLAGLRERVARAGGIVGHGRTGDRWRLAAMLPTVTGQIEERPALDRTGSVRSVGLGIAAAVAMFLLLPASMLLGGR